MPIPDFQTMMLPILKILSDGQKRRNGDISKEIANHFSLTDEEKRELLPSGSQRTHQNRSNWAVSYLNGAGILERPQRGVYQISEKGKELLDSNPEKINVQTLSEISQFSKWLKGGKGSKLKSSSTGKANESLSVTDKTPDETIEILAREINDQLASELLDQLGKMDPFKFEQLIVDLMLAMGYGGSRAEAGKVTQASNDGGIDGVINEDRLGLDTIYLQAKRWENAVGRREIQSFVGALAGRQAHKGVFITTSSFGKNAIEYANTVSQKIILINGERLAQLMIDFDIGVGTDKTINIKKIDTDYFDN